MPVSLNLSPAPPLSAHIRHFWCWDYKGRKTVHTHFICYRLTSLTKHEVLMKRSWQMLFFLFLLWFADVCPEIFRCRDSDFNFFFSFFFCKLWCYYSCCVHISFYKRGQKPFLDMETASKITILWVAVSNGSWWLTGDGSRDVLSISQASYWLRDINVTDTDPHSVGYVPLKDLTCPSFYKNKHLRRHVCKFVFHSEIWSQQAMLTSFCL